MEFVDDDSLGRIFTFLPIPHIIPIQFVCKRFRRVVLKSIRVRERDWLGSNLQYCKLDDQGKRDIEWFTSVCARENHFDLMKWSVSQRCPWGFDTASLLAESGNLEAFKFAVSHGCPYSALKISDLLQLKDIDTLEWGLREGLEFDKNFYHKAAGRGDLEAIKWGRKKGKDWVKLTQKASAHNESSYDCAARNGHLDVIIWMKENGNHDHMSLSFIKSIAEKQFHVSDWLCSQGIPLVNAKIPQNMNIQIGEWFKKNIEGWKDVLRQCFQLDSTVESLEWAKENGLLGVDWGFDRVALEAVINKNMDTLIWLKENGILNMSKVTSTKAMETMDLPFAQWCLNNGSRVTQNTTAIVKWRSIEAYLWAKDLGIELEGIWGQACSEGNRVIMKHVFKKAEPSEISWTVNFPDLETLKFAIELGWVPCEYQTEWAARNGDWEILEYLIKLNVGWNPYNCFEEALRRKNYEILKWIMANSTLEERQGLNLKE